MDEEVTPLTCIEVLVKLYLRGREEPILAPTQMMIPHHSPLKTAADVVDFCTEILLDDLDQRSARWLVLGDSTETKRMFLTADVQHLVVFAPENFDRDGDSIDE